MMQDMRMARLALALAALLVVFAGGVGCKGDDGPSDTDGTGVTDTDIDTTDGIPGGDTTDTDTDTDTDADTDGPVCGNNVVEGAEQCDGTDLAGQTCEGLGFAGGTLGCTASCTFDTTGCADDTGPVCGNNVVEGTEECDGTDLAGQTCESLELGFDGGTLACATDCTFDTSACTEPDPVPFCGDGEIGDDEECDGDNLGEETCEGLGFPGGTLACRSNCTFDRSGCDAPATCGNDEIDDLEECDGDNLDDETCESLGFAGGELACAANCQFDTSACTEPEPFCGDGEIGDDEDCDGANLGGETCEGLGFPGGTLGCTATCTFDISACEAPATCGNDDIDDGEDCDGDNLGGETCESQGFDSGDLACTANCRFDTSDCAMDPVGPECGNGVLEEGEECDDGEDNSDFRPNACRTDCTLPTCGDGVVDDGEECDDGADNGPDAACTLECTINAEVACAGSGDVLEFVDVAVAGSSGVLRHSGQLAPMEGEGFATDECGDADAAWRTTYFVRAPEAGVWEFSLSPQGTTAEATLIALEGCDAQSPRLGCGDAAGGESLVIEAAEGDAFFLAIEGVGNFRGYTLEARRFDALAGDGEACGAGIRCEDGLACPAGVTEPTCTDITLSTIDSLEILLPGADRFLVEMRGTDPARILDQVHIELITLDGATATDITLPPDVLLRDGDSVLMRLIIPVNVFDGGGAVFPIDDWQSFTGGMASSTTGFRTGTLQADFPGSGDLLDPEVLDPGALCDLDRLLNVCPEGEACGEDNGSFVCGEPAAPVLDTVVTERTGVDAIRFTISGSDDNADVVAVLLTLWREGETEPAFAYAPFNTEDRLRGQQTFTFDLDAQQERLNGLLNESNPAFGYDSIGVQLVDATGLVSDLVVVDYPPITQVGEGEACDINGLENVCAAPFQCGAQPGGNAVCEVASAPEVLSVDFTLDENGVPLIVIEGFHANANVTGWDLQFRVANPDDPELPFIGIPANQPVAALTPNPAGRVSFVATLPAVNLGGLEVVSARVRLRSGTLLSTFVESPLDAPAAGSACDAGVDWNPCANGLVCVDGTCQPGSAPVLEQLTITRPAANRVVFELTGTDEDANAEFVELFVRQGNNLSRGWFTLLPDESIFGESSFTAVLDIQGFENEPAGSLFDFRLRDRSGLVSDVLTGELPPIIAEGEDCADGTGIVDVCALGLICEDGTCVVDESQGVCTMANILDFDTESQEDEDTGERFLDLTDNAYFIGQPMTCAGPVTTSRAIQVIAPATGRLVAEAVALEGGADPVLQVSRDSCEAEPFACNDDIDFPANTDSRLSFDTEEGEVLFFFVGNWEAGGDIRFSFTVDDEFAGVCDEENIVDLNEVGVIGPDDDLRTMVSTESAIEDVTLSCSFGEVNSFVVVSWTAPETGEVAVFAIGDSDGDLDPILEVVAGECSSEEILACNDAIDFPFPEIIAAVVIDVVEGETYYFRVGTFDDPGFVLVSVLYLEDENGNGNGTGE